MMASNYGKGIPLSCGFDIGAKALADDRCLVADRAELESMPDILRADGLIVYVKDERRPYVWDEGTREWVALLDESHQGKAVLYAEGGPREIEGMDIQLGTVVTVLGSPHSYYVKTTDGLIEIKNYDSLFEAITDDVKDIVGKTTALETQTQGIKDEVEKISAILANMNLVVPEFYNFGIVRNGEKVTTYHVPTGGSIESGVRVSWELRQSSVSLESIIITTVNGEVSVDPSFNGQTLSGLPNKDQEITIRGTYVKDGLNYTTDTLRAYINFMDVVYYGVSDEVKTPTAEFIKSLGTTYNYSEEEKSETSYTMRVGKGKYFYFCLPADSINSLYLSLNIGVVIANSGIVLVDKYGGVSYPYIGEVHDYKGVMVDGLEYAVIRTDRPGIGMLRFSFNIVK